ncbi:MAG TPA: glycosyltransferase family 2 protein [Egibacteraceae bacterium]|nr:glycosyltransferase family 2 protein [Egibacteraceae bacterium]
MAASRAPTGRSCAPPSSSSTTTPRRSCWRAWRRWARPGSARVLELDNLGFGKAANAGVAATTAEALVIANADTRFPAGSVRAMADHLRDNPRVGALGPLIRFPDGRLQWSARAFPSVGQAIGHALLGMWRPDNRWTRAYRLTDWDHRSEREVDWVSGACLALRREAFDQVGGFDPSYFMFVEDVDLCARLWEAGWTVVFSPVAEVTHAVGASVGARPFRMVVEHARSLNFFFTRRYAHGWRRALVPFIRAGLVGWVLAAWTWSALRGRSIGHA